MIRTRYTTTGTGAGRILAKGQGRQKTVPYDHSHTPQWNHGDAAGELALLLFSGKRARRIAAEACRHIGRADGSHEFRFDI